jgi:hypothetical protein
MSNWVLFMQTEYNISYFEWILVPIEGTNCSGAKVIGPLWRKIKHSTHDLDSAWLREIAIVDSIEQWCNMVQAYLSHHKKYYETCIEYDFRRRTLLPSILELGSPAVLFRKIVKKKMESSPLENDIRRRKPLTRKRKRAESMFRYSTGQNSAL